jgi:hypothetical protein
LVRLSIDPDRSSIFAFVLSNAFFRKLIFSDDFFRLNSDEKHNHNSSVDSSGSGSSTYVDVLLAEEKYFVTECFKTDKIDLFFKSSHFGLIEMLENKSRFISERRVCDVSLSRKNTTIGTYALETVFRVHTPIYYWVQTTVHEKSNSFKIMFRRKHTVGIKGSAFTFCSDSTAAKLLNCVPMYKCGQKRQTKWCQTFHTFVGIRIVFC